MEDNKKELHAIIIEYGCFTIEWQELEYPVEESRAVFEREIEKRFHEGAGSAMLFLGFSSGSASLSPSLAFLRTVAASFATGITRNPEIENVRESFRPSPDAREIDELIRNAPFIPGSEYLDESWMLRMWERLNEAFSSAIKAYRGTVAEFIAGYNTEAHIAGRVFFHLVESKKEEYPFAFLATYSAGIEEGGKPRHLPLKHALQEFGRDSRKLLDLLVTVQRASAKSRFVTEILETGELFHPLALSAKEAYTVLKEIPLYEESGILCRIPDWWKKRSGSVSVNVTVGTKIPSSLGIDALLDFDASLSLGGEQMSVEDAQRLLAESEGLALIKGRWVEVDHEKLTRTLEAYERARGLLEDGVSINDAIRSQLGSQAAFGGGSEGAEIIVTNGQWLASALAKLTRTETMEAPDCGGDFLAELRPYQQKGVSWLSLMNSLGFGACMADDMGLGKTVQVIALLNQLRTNKKANTASLLVVPASLIANWMNELRRFAPGIIFRVAHPTEYRNPGDDRPIDPGSCDLVITTYGLAARYEWISGQTWNFVILDEAQAIKNPGTKQTKAVKRLRSANKIVMTGTPIENHLSDLWSLFDFLNPGLLGTAKEFTAFTKGLAESPGGYGRLKNVVSPFILRRVKTDKSVISDLPEKIEMKTYATLSRKQAVLYAALVEDVREKLEEAVDGIKRKGVILASIMKFKQICNHPDQYLGTGSYNETESGKYACLAEICETISEKRERAIVFTQFREITEPLRVYLGRIFGHEGLVLHGEVPVAKRKTIVEKFQADEYVPFMVLSIKAGGVGLNFTQASHVIHFDRWWNPAVENQATDRAFRIGQKKNVVVHKFVTRGTIEEKIDAIIESKQKLAGEIIPDSGESWITEMGNKELIDLMRLTV